MPSAEYRVTINGFRVMAETWDDAGEWDGKRDEIFLSTGVTVVNRSGAAVYKSQPTSPVLGDVNNQPGRVLAGSASPRGGLRTGDSYPTRTPWHRQSLESGRDWPPCLGELTEIINDQDRADCRFRIVPGLSDPQSISFESVNYPGYYLRHQDFRIKLQQRTSDLLFALDSTFRRVPGLADTSAFSFESVNYPGYFIRHRGFEMLITPDPLDGGPFRSDATFVLTS